MVKRPQEPPAQDPVAREKQLINLAVDLAEKQLIEGTASPSVLTHYLKLASTRETVEREILEKQAKLITAKTDSISQAKDTEEMVKQAIDAMRTYSGSN
jgi:hypothetical protein